MISVHPHVYDRLIEQYPDLVGVIVPELKITQSAAWHAGGTPPDWLKQFGPGTVEWLHTDFIGLDHIPDVGSTLITNGKGTTEDIVAEWVLTATLMACKRLGHYKKWSDRFGQKPILLKDAVIAIIGRGAIGSESMRLLKSAGARDVTVTGASALAPTRRADIVVVATSRRAETVGLINATEMALWKTGSWLVSISHGGVINDLDLSDGLAKGLPAGAIVDCFETEPLPDNSELWSLAILSPHLSWYSPESTNRRVETFRARLKEWQGT
jgi:phosphoglycerate dehydrogenase-like enzyme